MFLKCVIRNLLKRPFLNLIKVLGLSLSWISIMLILLFLKNEFSYDRFHRKSDRIYRLTVTDDTFIAGRHFARVYDPSYIPLMADYFPDIENFVRMAPMRGGVLKYNEEYIPITQAFECDSTFFQVFDAELVTGSLENVLADPASMVVSESFAEKVFGRANPVGQVLIMPAGQYYGSDLTFTIKGIMKDFPQNSHFHPELITTPANKSIFEDWAWTYLLLIENADPGEILSGFKEFYTTHVREEDDESHPEVHLQRIADIHLHSSKLREIEPNGNMSVIYALSIAALILLLIAYSNYMNLTIGMAGFSDKLLFISKVSGSSGWMTLRYFLYEGMIILVLSAVVSGSIGFPANRILQQHYGVDLFKGNWFFMIMCFVSFGFLSILLGLLPLLKQGIASVVTSTNYNDSIIFRRKGISKGIIVVQYTISILLIIAVLVIHRQTAYAMDKSMGAGNDNLICFEDVHTDLQLKFELFKEELMKYGSIESVSAMLEPPGGEANDMFEFTLEGKVKNSENPGDNYIGIFPCDHSFASVFHLKFLAGTNFSSGNIDREGYGEYIINESAMRRFQYTDPIQIVGKVFQLHTNMEEVRLPEGRIIGVVEDFHLSSLKKAVEPLVLFKRRDLWLLNFVVSYHPGMQAKALADIRSVWEKLFPGYLFQYKFVSSMYERVYKAELLQARLLFIFTVIALIISSMGMLGLTLLTTQRRTKELGIRKINGAGTGKVLIMLYRDLLKWILLSCLLAIPLGFYSMHWWLGNFVYKIRISWWIYIVAALIALMITLVTVTFLSWRAASRNPVEALRYE